MFGVEKRVKRVRDALVRSLRAKSMEIARPHIGKDPTTIPWMDTAKAIILSDLAEIILTLQVEEIPEDKA